MIEKFPGGKKPIDIRRGGIRRFPFQADNVVFLGPRENAGQSGGLEGKIVYLSDKRKPSA